MKTMERIETAYCAWCNKPFPKDKLLLGKILVNGKARIYKFCPKCAEMVRAQDLGNQILLDANAQRNG